MYSSHSSKMKPKGFFWIFLFQKVDWQLVFMGSAMGVVCSTNRSVMNFWYCCSQPDVKKMPQLGQRCPWCWVGLPISSMTSTSSLSCFPKVTWKLLVCSWWLVSRSLWCFLSRDALNSLVIITSSGPATTQRLRASGDWVSPTAPPSLFHYLYQHCFAHVPGPEPWIKTPCWFLQTVKLPFMNSIAVSGWIMIRLNMSRI